MITPRIRGGGMADERTDDPARLTHIAQIYKTARTAVRSAAVVGVVYLLREPLNALAGETTRLALELSIAADLKFVMSVTLAGAASAWAIAERRLRHRKVEELQGRIRTLETRVDPGRTSSGLTPKGTTHPRDMEV